MADTAPRFAPDDLGFVADPYPVYAHLREQAPGIYGEATVTTSRRSRARETAGSELEPCRS